MREEPESYGVSSTCGDQFPQLAPAGFGPNRGVVVCQTSDSEVVFVRPGAADASQGRRFSPKHEGCLAAVAGLHRVAVPFDST